MCSNCDATKDVVYVGTQINGRHHSYLCKDCLFSFLKEDVLTVAAYTKCANCGDDATYCESCAEDWNADSYCSNCGDNGELLCEYCRSCENCEDPASYCDYHAQGECDECGYSREDTRDNALVCYACASKRMANQPGFGTFTIPMSTSTTTTASTPTIYYTSVTNEPAQPAAGEPIETNDDGSHITVGDIEINWS